MLPLEPRGEVQTSCLTEHRSTECRVTDGTSGKVMVLREELNNKM